MYARDWSGRVMTTGSSPSPRALVCGGRARAARAEVALEVEVEGRGKIDVEREVEMVVEAAEVCAGRLLAPVLRIPSPTPAPTPPAVDVVAESDAARATFAQLRSGAPTEPPTTNLTPAYAGLAAVVAILVFVVLRRVLR